MKLWKLLTVGVLLGINVEVFASFLEQNLMTVLIQQQFFKDELVVTNISPDGESACVGAVLQENAANRLVTYYRVDKVTSADGRYSLKVKPSTPCRVTQE